MKSVSVKEMCHFKSFNEKAITFLNSKGIEVEFEHYRVWDKNSGTQLRIPRTLTNFKKLFKSNSSLISKKISPTCGFTLAKFTFNGVQTVVKYNHKKHENFCKRKGVFVCLKKYLASNSEFEAKETLKER